MKYLFVSGNWKIGRNIKTVGGYEGELKEGKRHGLGKIIKKNGSIMYGEFKDDFYNGQGVFTFAKGNQY